MFVATFIMLWFLSNYPPYKDLAIMYVIFAITGILYWTLDYVISLSARKDQINPPPYTQIINTAFYEKNTIIGPIPTPVRIGSYIITIFMCIMLAFWIGASETTIVGVPDFQIIDLGISGVIIVTIFMAIIEDVVFFGLLAPTISGIGRVISFGNQIVGAILALIITPLTFMLYHFLTYGASNLQGSFFVYAFALVATSYVIIFRNLIAVNCLHVTNNITLKIAGAIGVAIGG